jgi:rubrerythrin
MSFHELRDILDLAIGFELKTAAFYRSLMPLFPAGPRRETVEALVRQEEGHARQLTEFKGSMTQVGFLQTGFTLDLPPLPEPHVIAGLSTLQMIQLALEVERWGVEVYGRMAERAPNEVIRDFFAALRRFEQGHIDLLTRELAYAEATPHDVPEKRQP